MSPSVARANEVEGSLDYFFLSENFTRDDRLLNYNQKHMKKLPMFTSTLLFLIVFGLAFWYFNSQEVEEVEEGIVEQEELEKPVLIGDEIGVSISFKLVSRENLIGSWQWTQGPASWQSIILDQDGNYYTHLHDRPFDSGTWNLESGILSLDSEVGEEMDLSFKDLKLSKEDNLNMMRVIDDATVSVWERIK